MPWRDPASLKSLYPTMFGLRPSSGPGSPLVTPRPVAQAPRAVTAAEGAVLRLYNPMPGLESKADQKC